MARTNGRLQDPHAFSEIPGWDDDDSDVLFRARNLPDFLPHRRPFNHAAKWDFREMPSWLLPIGARGPGTRLFFVAKNRGRSNLQTGSVP
jgi:hypothetical protein